jgi:hypothetical protein
MLPLTREGEAMAKYLVKKLARSRTFETVWEVIGVIVVVCLILGGLALFGWYLANPSPPARVSHSCHATGNPTGHTITACGATGVVTTTKPTP